MQTFTASDGVGIGYEVFGSRGLRPPVIAGDNDPLATSPEVLVRAMPDARLKWVPGDHMSAIFDPSFCESLVAFVGEG